MKSSIYKYAQTKNKNSKLHFFSATKFQTVTGKNLFKTQPYRHLHTEEVLQLIESISMGWQADSVRPANFHKKQIDDLNQIKMFALLGVPTAIIFYNELIENYQRHEYSFNVQLFNNAKDIALYTQNPYLLIKLSNIYFNKIVSKESAPYLDVKNGFSCLKAAANMHGMNNCTALAIYTLAAAYAEAALTSQHSDAPSPTFLSTTKNNIQLLKENDLISNETVNKNIQALEQLAYGPSGALYAKEQFLIYFELAWSHAITFGAIRLPDNHKIASFNDLIKLKIEIDKNISTNQIGYSYYLDQLKNHAIKGNVSAMHALSLLDQHEKHLGSQLHTEYKEKIDIKYLNYEKENEIYEKKMRLVINELENQNSSSALKYFRESAINSAYPISLMPDSYGRFQKERIKVIEEISQKIPLNTVQKIECFFELCTDILMEIENLSRLECCQYITKTLRVLFGSKAKPNYVSKWLMINEKNISLKRAEKDFPLFTRENIKMIMDAITNEAKQELLSRKYLHADMFDHIKALPLASDDAAHQLIENFLLPLNADIFYQIGDETWIYKKQAEQLNKLKELTLSGNLTAIAFYRGLFRLDMYRSEKTNDTSVDVFLGYEKSYKCYDHNVQINPQHFIHELLSQMKDVAFATKDPYLLMCLYVIKTNIFPLLDLEDAFFCLQEAAKMDGASAMHAAYCLANYYGCELVEEDSSYLSVLANVNNFLLYNRAANIDEARAIKNLRALSKMGSSLAKSHLIKFFTLSTAAFDREIHSIPPSDDLRKQFYYYFDLALNKSIEMGLANVKVPFLRKSDVEFSVNFYDLVQWKMEIESIYDNCPHNNIHPHYYEVFLSQEKEGKIGAMLALISLSQKAHKNPNWNLIHEFLNKVDIKNYPHGDIVLAKIANQWIKYYSSAKQKHPHLDIVKEKAAQLGCIDAAASIAIDKFEHDPVVALAYFRKIATNAHLYEPPFLFSKQLFVVAEIQKYEKNILDTAEKIDCYFQMCADILTDFTNPMRFDCCEVISDALDDLFPDEQNRPDEISQWMLDADEIAALKFKEFAPIFKREGIRKTVAALTLLAKEAISHDELRHETPRP